jgi:hypothetical protein
VLFEQVLVSVSDRDVGVETIRVEVAGASAFFYESSLDPSPDFEQVIGEAKEA